MARILIIEDNKHTRKLVRTALEASKYEVDEAADGAAGIYAYLRYGPDLVLCDLVMPGREGLETIRELRQHDPEARIVAMSGGSADGSLSWLPLAAKLGACDTIAKPFTGEEILVYVDELLRGHSSRRC